MVVILHPQDGCELVVVRLAVGDGDVVRRAESAWRCGGGAEQAQKGGQAGLEQERRRHDNL
jgi:hypothetical protein